MKTLVWFVCAAVLLLSGCEGQGAASSADTQADAMSVEEETVDSYSSMRAWYYIEKSDAKGETTFGENAGYIEAGEPVALLRDGELQSHEADGRPLLPAKLDGEDIWVSAYFIGQGTRRAAVAAEDPATVYTGLDIVDNTRYSLTRGQQITVFPQTSEEAKSGRIRFFGYDLELGNGETENFGRYSRGSEWYLSEDAVTTSDDDVAVLDYLAVIDSRPVDLQLEPLQILEQENTDSTFHDLITQRIEVLQAESEPPRQTESYTAEGRLVGANVRVRDQPDERLDNVVGVIEEGSEVSVTQKTVEIYEILGEQAPWYYVETEELSGWIFGSFFVADM